MRLAKSVALAALALLAALYLWSSLVGARDDAAADQAAITAIKKWHARHEADRLASDANRQRQAVLLRTMVTALDAANRFRDSASHADTLPPPKPDADPATLHWYSLAEWRRLQVDSLTSAVDASQSAMLLARADAARWRRDAEEGVAASLLASAALRQRSCHVGPFACPSRTVSFLAGAGAVLVVAAALRR